MDGCMDGWDGRWGGVVDRRCMYEVQNQIIFCILLNKKNRTSERHIFLKRQADKKMGFLRPHQGKEHKSLDAASNGKNHH